MHFNADPKELIGIFGAIFNPDVEEGPDIIISAAGCRVTAKKQSIKTGIETGIVSMVFEPGKTVISQNQMRMIQQLRH